MSGKECFSILDKIFVPKNKQKIEDIKGYSMKYGQIVEKDNIIDEVLVTYFKEPKSYTTENMCEINSHGGIVIVRKILEICLKNGAELAEPGEFTKRAFLNGRIDLLQAESVIDVINAKSEREANVGINQLQGGLSNKIQEIKQEILDTMVNIEVSIDYPEYDVEEVTKQEIATMLNSIEPKLKQLEKSFDDGKLIKEGIKTAIIGKPNAGKSSLLNAILKEERAIVTQYEGTTRDTIEEFVTVNGIPLKLVDTAGIRNAQDEVEKIGIEKSKEIASNADLVIAIFDASRDLSKEDYDILEILKDKKSIIVFNKSDLNTVLDENRAPWNSLNKPIIKISALKQEGIEEIYQQITKMFNLNEISYDNEMVITNIRHKNLIYQAIQDIEKTRKSIEENMPVDIIAMNLKEIMELLSNITGETVTEDIINEIFSKFCLGK